MSIPQLLSFSRNRTTSVERLDRETLRASCRLQDTLTEAEVTITVALPDLEITGVESRVIRSPDLAAARDCGGLGKAVGVRIGPGMSKIIQGLVGDSVPFRQLVFMVEECCHGVILYFTKDDLALVPEDLEEARSHFARLVRKNIRLYNRCAAFAPGSSIVEGIEPPGENHAD